MKAMIYYVESQEYNSKAAYTISESKHGANGSKAAMINYLKSLIGSNCKWVNHTDKTSDIEYTATENGYEVCLKFPPQKKESAVNCIVLYDEIEKAKYVLKDVQFFEQFILSPSTELKKVLISVEVS